MSASRTVHKERIRQFPNPDLAYADSAKLRAVPDSMILLAADQRQRVFIF